MTIRAVIVGLLGAAFVAGFTYFNDNIMRQTLFIGNHMPHSVYGTLILFLLLVNPLIALLKRRWAFTGAELAVVLALTLAACAIPGAGLMRFFTNALMLPHHKAKTRPGWQSEEVLDMVPEHLLAGTSARFRTTDIRDPRGLCTGLARDLTAGTLAEPRKRIWAALSDEHQQAMLRAGQSAEDIDRAAVARIVVRAFNSLLGQRELYDPKVFSGVALPAEASRILARQGGAPRPGSIHRSEERDLRELNRHLIDVAWPDEIYSHVMRRHDELHTFLFGMKKDREPVWVDRVPWSAWVRPLVFWIPLVVVLLVGLIGLAVVVHKQWSDHEQLPYPVARFAVALLPAEGKTKGSVLRNRLFLGSAGLVLAIHMANYAYTWWPRYIIPIRTQFDFSPLQQLWPALSGPVARWAIFTVRIYFIAVGLAYFVSSEVSLSIGIAAPICFYIRGVMEHYGISMGGSGLYSGSPRQTFHIGAYLGILLMFLYTGRRYYASVFRRAFFLRAADEVAIETVWGARVFVVCAGVFTLYLVAMGIDWPLAPLYTVLAFTLFVVMARILAETGLFFLEPRWYPCAFLVALFGIRAVGPTTALLMFLVSTMLLVVPRESLMPFVVNSFKVLGTQKVPVGRAAVWCGVAVLLALVIAVPVTLMFQYGAGTHRWDTWGYGAVPRYSFDKTVEHKERLRAQGALEEAESVRGLARFWRARPQTRSVVGFGAGLGLVVLLAAARLRVPWWPLHPVIAVAFWSYPGAMFWPSFLLGWLIKKVVIKYGGQRLYKRLIPAMLGLIAGDMLGMLIPSIIGSAYYLIAGHPAPSFLIMPD